MESALIVDPDSNNRMVLSKLLRVAGIQSVQADSGAMAAGIFSRQPFDIAILNNTLTDIPAATVARRLRRRMEAENFGPDTRIVAIIAKDSNRKAFSPYLINAFLIPPITSSEFARALGVTSLSGHVKAHARSKSFAEKMNGPRSSGYSAVERLY